MTDLSKYMSIFACPKCASDKCSTRLDTSPEVAADGNRRSRLRWPLAGELMVQTCAICGHVQISRPLDYQTPAQEAESTREDREGK